MSPDAAAVWLLRCLDPETAHRLTLRALRAGLAGGRPAPDDPVLGQVLWGRRFPNPVGLAAGFDKDAEALGALFDLGFGFVEVGTVTPEPQPGNPRPRVFRLPGARAVINRYGFNSAGVRAVAANLRAYREAGGTGIVGVNLGKNRDSADAGDDYAAGVRALAGDADYLVVNVSSPNTPDLRALQGRDALDSLLDRVRTALDATGSDATGSKAPPPLLLKIAPDLTAADRADIAAVALARGVDGLIVSNTTTARPAGIRDRHRDEPGGLSGRPLFRPSTDLLAEMFRLSDGKLRCIGVGGIESGGDAYAKIRAGASLVQFYTAMIYQGPALVGRITRELHRLLRQDGFASIADAVGADHRPGTSQ